LLKKEEEKEEFHSCAVLLRDYLVDCVCFEQSLINTLNPRAEASRSAATSFTSIAF
jgi:hypothetical protein